MRRLAALDVAPMINKYSVLSSSVADESHWAGVESTLLKRVEIMLVEDRSIEELLELAIAHISQRLPPLKTDA